MPVIGLLDQRSPDQLADRLRAFRQGLKEAGLIEGQNAGIEYRWSDNRPDRLPDLAAELVRRQVAVIVATGALPTVLAAPIGPPSDALRDSGVISRARICRSRWAHELWSQH